MKVLKGIWGFIKKYTVLWIIIAIVGIFAGIDLINYSQYSMQCLKIYTDENPSGDVDKNYFSTPEKDNYVYFDVYVSKNGKPVANHTLVGDKIANGEVQNAYRVTNNDGIATFSFHSNIVTLKDVDKQEIGIFVYDENTAWVIEFRLENSFYSTLTRRPE